MKTNFLLLVLLCAGFSIDASSQTGLFIDYTQSGWWLQIGAAAPNTTYNYVMIQSAGTGTISYSLAENGTYSNPQAISIVTDANGNGQTLFFVKGTGLGPATWQVCDPGPANCGGTLQFAVVTINSLEYAAIDSPLDTNPNSGGGNRMYPDKISPSDSINRKRVRVKATLSAPVNNLNIYFKSFDLDDPTTDSGPVDPNGSAGGDNRGASSGILSPANQTGTGNTVTLTSDTSGIATADLTVTMYAGDNFMAAASGDPTIIDGIQIDGITLKDAGNNTLPITKAKNTPMITVWRKIHLELDSMGNVGTSNNVQGTITAVSQGSNGCTPQPPPPQPCWANYTIYTVNPNTTIDTDRFDNGRIKIGSKSYDVWVNDATHIAIKGIGATNGIVGKAFTLYDDDDFNSDGTQKDGDNNEALVQLPETLKYLSTTDGTYSDGRPMNVYSVAYITPEYSWAQTAGYNQSNLSFVLNEPSGSISTDLSANRNSASSESDEFWVAYLLVAYQGATDSDGDGETAAVSGTGPSTSSTNLCDCYQAQTCIGSSCSIVPTGVSGSFVFQEVMQDVTRSFLYYSGLVVENKGTTAPHELGHQFGLDGDNRDPITHLSTRNPTTYGIMDYPNRPSESDSYILHPEHINLLRWRVKSPGQ